MGFVQYKLQVMEQALMQISRPTFEHENWSEANLLRETNGPQRATRQRIQLEHFFFFTLISEFLCPRIGFSFVICSQLTSNLLLSNQSKRYFFQPITSKNKFKTNYICRLPSVSRPLRTLHVFPRFARTTAFEIPFWLVHCVLCVCFDQPVIAFVLVL